MVKALERVGRFLGVPPGGVKVDKVPPNRLVALARNGLGSKAPNLERAAEPKRTVLLTSVVRHLEASAIDDALDLLTLLMRVKLIGDTLPDAALVPHQATFALLTTSRRRSSAACLFHQMM